MSIKSIKKFIWKFFPPKEITDEDIRSAAYEFENARRAATGEQHYLMNYYNYQQTAFDNLNRLVRKQKDYQEYINTIKNV